LARRRRRWRDVFVPAFVGAAVAAFTLGALSRRVTDLDDLLPAPVEALILGTAFALASMPRRWAMVPRALLPVPTFFLYLSVLLGKLLPVPYWMAFIAAACCALLLTTLSAYFAERPRWIRLGQARDRPARHG
jgi:hypothetical protein